MSVFGEKFEVEKQPTQYCIGVITGAENLRDSKNNPLNKVIDLKIKPVLGRKRKDGETFYLVVRESWFQPGTSKNDIEKGGERFMFDRFFGKKGQRGIINVLFTDEQVADLGELVKLGGVTIEDFFKFLNEAVTNTVRGYTLEQGSDTEEVTDPETGETKKQRYRTEFLGVGKFFGPDEVDSIQKSFVKAVERAATESAAEERDVKPSMKIHWEISEEVNPFQSVVEQLNAAA